MSLQGQEVKLIYMETPEVLNPVLHTCYEKGEHVTVLTTEVHKGSVYKSRGKIFSCHLD